MFGGPFQFVDAADVDPGPGANGLGRCVRDQPLRRHRITREEFDLQPCVVLVLSRPEGPHGRKTVSLDHQRLRGESPISCNRCSIWPGWELFGTTNVRSIGRAVVPSYQAFTNVLAAIA